MRDQYTWNEVPSSHNVASQATAIKKANMWLELRACYVDKKNFYLERRDRDHPSFIVYVEAVNEIYSRLPKKVPAKKAQKAVVPAKATKVPAKSEFNCSIQKALSKAKRYTNDTICSVASLACKNYDGKKNKKAVQNELCQKFGADVGNDIYTRIAPLLK